MKSQQLFITSILAACFLSACSPAKLSGVANSDAVQTRTSGDNSPQAPNTGGTGSIESEETTVMVPTPMPYPTPQAPDANAPKVPNAEKQIPQSNANPQAPVATTSELPETESVQTVPTSQILDSCFAPEEPCDQKLIAFLDSARISLDIAIYSITHPGIAQAIVRAMNRGVQVRMIVDREQATSIPTSLVDELIKAQVPLKFGTGKGYMHNKFAILDKTYLETGSYNYTRQATTRNAENQLYLKDPNVIARFQKGFDQLWMVGASD